MTEQSILDARLAEIDRRLRNIQSGLAGEGGVGGSGFAHVPQPGDLPAPATDIPVGSASAASGDSQAVRELLGELSEIIAAHQQLLASARELLAALGEARAPETAASTSSLAIAAGPFASTATLRAFERALLALPQVRDVQVREYTGEGRVVIDVLLSEPTT